LNLLEGEFSVWRLAADAEIPEVDPSSFLSVTRTEKELSVVSSTTEVAQGARAESGWRCLRVEGPLPFAMTGVLAALSAPLAEAGIPIFVISTFDTDYLLVKSADLERACSALRDASHTVDV
jgi:hypothetical protein